jgi:hypothetical protein
MIEVKCIRCGERVDVDLTDGILAEVVDKGGTMPADWICPKAPDRGPHERYRGLVVMPGGQVIMSH